MTQRIKNPQHGLSNSKTVDLLTEAKEQYERIFKINGNS